MSDSTVAGTTAGIAAGTAMMKAVFLTGAGEPWVVRETPVPVPAAEEVLIRLSYSALNHRDLWMQQGKYSGPKSGLIPGSDGVGVVVETGALTDPGWMGRPVIINPAFGWGEDLRAFGKDFTILGNPAPGTFAEYIAVPYAYVYPKPDHLTDEEAAALPLSGLTTYRAVHTRAKVEAGEKVLVTGIGAGTASLALQFALAAGAEVFVSSGSAEKIERALAMGAKGGFNYKDEDWVRKAKEMTGGERGAKPEGGGGGATGLGTREEQGTGEGVGAGTGAGTKMGPGAGGETGPGTTPGAGKGMGPGAGPGTGPGFDVILDSSSGKGFHQLLEVARPGGRIVFWGGADGPIGNILQQRIFWKNLTVMGTTMGSQPEFRDMLKHIARHGVKPVVDRVFPSLASAQEAVDYMAGGAQFGKIVLRNV